MPAKLTSKKMLIISLALACSLITIIISPSPASRLLSVFPGAQGYGTQTKAGRGGSILKVTNLNDSGSGSLRAAIDASGPRIIVFEVSGTISLAADLKIYNPYITIAGQTAPSPGITLKGASLRLRTHDILVQHIRIRVGDDPNGPSPDNRDCFSIDQSGIYNIVFDHVSSSWAIDEVGSTWYPLHDVTISNSIIAEGLSNSLHPKGEHSKGLLIGNYSTNIAVIGNLLASNVERGPRIESGSSVVVNNVIYNIGSSVYMAIGTSAGSSSVSAVGNAFIDGPNTPSGVMPIEVRSDASSGTKVYASDNIGSKTILTNHASFNPVASSPPIWPSWLTVLPSSSVESSVLAHAGARPADRDAVDARIVNEVRTRTGHIIDSQKEVGGWPNLAVNHRTFNIPTNPNGDDDGDGYTNIEEVLQEMAGAVGN